VGTWETVIVAAVVFLLAYGITRHLCSPAAWLRLLDHPNERSLHAAPTPRTGGLAILGSLVTGFVISQALFGDGAGSHTTSGWLIAAALLIGAVSFWDDRAGLPPGLRFAVHSAAAVIVVVGAGLTVPQISFPLFGTWSLGPLGPPLAVLFLMWMTNLYNFMDGMDGFAGGMTVVGFGFLAYVAYRAGHSSLAALALLVIAATAGFLVYNVPPARIFMGDVGSAPLGFLAGALSLQGVQEEVFDIWVPVLIFSPFLVDATTTLVQRLLRGEKVWQAHREHYYQRLVLSGWSHRKTVLIEYLLMVACGGSALLYVQAGERGRFGILAAWVLLYVTLARGVSRVEWQQREGTRGEI
jgi:UDP-N-acetylmuramyl pentapeptide phosphotransferase/UDP-N-acetylglucosamine-1-phosphate transferase